MTTTDKQIEDIISGYIEAMLWAETDDEDTPLDANYTEDDISAETMQRIREVCSRFYASVEGLECQYIGGGQSGYTTEQCLGHDLWLTSRGHGTGFWEDDRWSTTDDSAEEVSNINDLLCELAYDAHDPENKWPAARGCSDAPYVGDDGFIYLP